MADGIFVRITGPDLGPLVQSVNAEIEAGIEEILDKVAYNVQNDAKDDCPVDTGALQDDIKVYAAKLQRDIGNNIYYCIYVHNGTYKMKARPYLFNAFEKNNPGFIKDIQSMKVS